MKRALLLAMLAWGAIGCGGSSGDPGAGVRTYIYANANPITVYAGSCSNVAGPIDVSAAGSMFYQIDDALPATDSMEAVIIPDSFYLSEGCGFTYGQTLVDDSFVGSHSATGPVYADSYDFVVTCSNSDGFACTFNLTWTATY